MREAEQRKVQIRNALIRQLRELGCNVDGKFDWIEVDGHRVFSLKTGHIVQLNRRTRDYRYSLHLTITHMKGRSEHYPEPVTGWEDTRLRDFAKKALMEVVARNSQDAEETRRQEKKQQKRDAADAINDRMGNRDQEPGWVSVTPSGTFFVWLPRDLSEGEVALLSSFAKALPGLRSNPEVDQSKVGNARVYIVLEGEPVPMQASVKTVNIYLDGATHDDDPIVLTATPEERGAWKPDAEVDRQYRNPDQHGVY